MRDHGIQLSAAFVFAAILALIAASIVVRIKPQIQP